MPSDRRRRVAVVAAVAVVVAVVLTVVGLNARGASGPSAPLPATDAGPRSVATAFLDAAVRRDCGSLRALSSPDDTLWCPSTAWERLQGNDPRLRSWGGLRRVPGAADGQQCFSDDLRQTGVMGMDPGPITWGLCLQRVSGSWRVSSEGVG
ncbi:hypothetical protein [Curtobacterium sp. MCBA15_001]|uniref:hypothetical protein n=1 Tax=Curtobacterium sp. MCBA15_001 TaxID=1898731 RepID=UPI0008DD8973|nr:hypothetical protein [Curtobacterium sp. MCBA15_001]OIH94067.1 hypothetical protein BIU90_05965 [Curtobacterium sp. MCBA15_001]